MHLICGTNYTRYWKYQVIISITSLDYQAVHIAGLSSGYDQAIEIISEYR